MHEAIDVKYPAQAEARSDSNIYVERIDKEVYNKVGSNMEAARPLRGCLGTVSPDRSSSSKTTVVNDSLHEATNTHAVRVYPGSTPHCGLQTDTVGWSKHTHTEAHRLRPKLKFESDIGQCSASRRYEYTCSLCPSENRPQPCY